MEEVNEANNFECEHALECCVNDDLEDCEAGIGGKVGPRHVGGDFIADAFFHENSNCTTSLWMINAHGNL